MYFASSSAANISIPEACLGKIIFAANIPCSGFNRNAFSDFENTSFGYTKIIVIAKDINKNLILLYLKIQIDFFELIFTSAIRQKLFYRGQFGLISVKNISHLLSFRHKMPLDSYFSS